MYYHKEFLFDHRKVILRSSSKEDSEKGNNKTVFFVLNCVSTIKFGTTNADYVTAHQAALLMELN